MSKPKPPERRTLHAPTYWPNSTPGLGNQLAVFDMKMKCSVIGTVVEISGPWITLEFEP